MQSIILTLHVLIALSILALVLMQHGKGADIGATFGSGASNTMFGSQGAMPFLMKLTMLLAALFFSTSLGLTYMVSRAQHQAKASGDLVATPAAVKTNASAKPAASGAMDIPDSEPLKQTPSKKKK
jgi:preprotein translocase subunit SecG